MGYKSSKPSKEKKQFYDWMERNKKGGVVSYSKLKRYAERKDFRIVKTGKSKTATQKYGRPSDTYWGEIKNKKGRTIADVGTKYKKRPRIVWWNVK